MIRGEGEGRSSKRSVGEGKGGNGKGELGRRGRERGMKVQEGESRET